MRRGRWPARLSSRVPPALPLLLPLLLAGGPAPGAAPDAASPSAGRREASGAPGSLGPIAVGVRIQVKGTFLPDGAFLADEIEISQETDDEEELRGLIQSVDRDRRSLKVLGFTVRIEDDTVMTRDPGNPVSLDDLAPGLRVKVEGSREEDGAFEAEKIRVRERHYPERKILGPVEAIKTVARRYAVLRLVGLDVVINEATDLVGPDGEERPIMTRRHGVIDDDDLRVTGRNRIGRHLAVAGEVRLRGERLAGVDLEDDPGDRETVPEVLGIIALAAEFGPVLLYAELEGQREYLLRGGEGLESGEERGTIRAGEAYIELTHLPEPRLSMAIGRQKFNEAREWYYNNKNLDAVRVALDFERVSVEASVSRDLFDRTRNLDDQDRTNVIVQARWQALSPLAFEAFYVRRKDRGALEDSPRILGLRALGALGPHLSFWADVAREDGTRGWRDPDSGSVLAREVRAHALDLGLRYRPQIALDPSFTAGLALGSGDDELNLPSGQKPTGTDGTFRQTGLHRNRDQWNGVVSFRYYGELFDPELANLRILTLGAGLRPFRPFSVDLAFHRYRQDVAAPRIVESEIDADPSGADPNLGSEWDLVLGFEPSKQVELKLVASLFRPGPAFGDDASGARLLAFQSKFRF